MLDMNPTLTTYETRVDSAAAKPVSSGLSKEAAHVILQNTLIWRRVEDNADLAGKSFRRISKLVLRADQFEDVESNAVGRVGNLRWQCFV